MDLDNETAPVEVTRIDSVPALLEFWRGVAEAIEVDPETWSQAQRFLQAARSLLGTTETREQYIEQLRCALDLSQYGKLGSPSVGPATAAEIARLEARIVELERDGKA